MAGEMFHSSGMRKKEFIGINLHKANICIDDK